MFGKSFTGVALMAVVVGGAALTGACSDAASNPLCCTEFKVGATVSADIGGSAQSQVAVQTIADIAAIGASAVTDLTTACRNMAMDLGADASKTDPLKDKTGSDAMKAWCELAVSQIGVIKGSAQLTVEVKPPVCNVSISAQADCQAKCDVSGKCDIKANPPKCTGGTLEIDCKGSCTAEAGASVSCTGSCSGKCEGDCTASGGVDCSGSCDGTCEAKAGVGNGNGAQADGTCQGTCKGTCKANAIKVECKGSCSGKCDAACQGSATASVKCDGKCDADYQPLQCSGGKLEGGCQVDAKCQGNCNASASAKATCSPAQVTIAFSGDVDSNLGKLQATLEANLPLVLGIKAKLAVAGDGVVALKGNIDAVTDIKAACIPPLLAAAGQAVSDFSDSITVTASVAGSIGQ